MLQAEREATTAAMNTTQDDLAQLRAALAAEKRNNIDILERKDEEHARCVPSRLFFLLKPALDTLETCRQVRLLEQNHHMAKEVLAAQVEDLTRQLARKVAEQELGRHETEGEMARRETEVAKLRQQVAKGGIRITNLEETVSVLEQENSDLQSLVDALSDKLRRLTTSYRKSVDMSDTESNFGWGEADDRLFEGDEALSPGPSPGPAAPRRLPSSPVHSPIGFDRTPAPSPRQTRHAVLGNLDEAEAEVAPPLPELDLLPPPPLFEAPAPTAGDGDVFTFDQPPLPPPPPAVCADEVGRVLDPPPLPPGCVPEIEPSAIPGWDLAAIGSRVVVSNYGDGTLRWVGYHAHHSEPRCGVELDASIGKNDGTVGGCRYFSCAAGHGVLAKPSRISLAHPRKPSSRPESSDSGHVEAPSVSPAGPSMQNRRYAAGVATLHTDDHRPLTWLDDDDDASSQATANPPQFDLSDALSL